MGWRYCKPVWGKNSKLKPDTVLVGGKEEVHSEGAYYLNVDGQWEKCGKSAAEAQEERSRRLARQRYERETGERLPEPKPKGKLPSDAIDACLTELELKVAGKSRRPKTLAASRQALNEFAEQSRIKHASEVSASAIAKHMAWVIQNSRTRSARTAANKFVLILQFLKHTGSVPMVGVGKSARPLGLRDAPRYTEKPVEKCTDDELARFFFACGKRENAIFQTFARAGLREQELATLRRVDCVFGTDAPCLRIVERPEYGFVPKWFRNCTCRISAWTEFLVYDSVLPTSLSDAFRLFLLFSTALRLRSFLSTHFSARDSMIHLRRSFLEESLEFAALSATFESNCRVFLITSAGVRCPGV